MIHQLSLSLLHQCFFGITICLLMRYLTMMENEYPPTKLDRADVFFGVAGRAYIYWRLYVNYNDTQYLTKAKAYISLAIENIKSLDESQVGFNWGRTGVHCVAAVIFDALQDSCGRGMHVQSVKLQ